ncbi:MAG TPA: hypothetical protein VF411_11880 [Bacteroidia bacterium]
MRLKTSSIFLFVLFLSLNISLAAQNLFPSRVKIETKIADSTWYGESYSSIVQVNEASGEIAFKMDISSITTEIPRADSALASMGRQYVYLKGSFPVKNLSFTDADNESSEEYTGKAMLTIFDITKEVSYSFEVYNFNNDDEFAVGNNVYPLRIGLFFTFEPKDFNVNKLSKALVNTIEVEVSNGFINKTNLGGDTIFPK